MAKHSISLSDAVSAVANEACKPINENRDFSNLCEVALTEFLTKRSYVIIGTGAPIKSADAEFHMKLSDGLKKSPEIKSKIEKILRQYEGTRRRAVAGVR